MGPFHYSQAPKLQRRWRRRAHLRRGNDEIFRVLGLTENIAVRGVRETDIDLVYMVVYDEVYTLKGDAVRTNIVLDDDLVEEASRLTNIRTKRELIRLALQVLIRQRSRKNLSDLKGKITFHEGYDHKKLREGK